VLCRSVVRGVVSSTADAKAALDARERDRMLRMSKQEAFASRIQAARDRVDAARDKAKTAQLENRRRQAPEDVVSELVAEALRIIAEADALYEVLIDDPMADARMQQYLTVVPRAETKVRLSLVAPAMHALACVVGGDDIDRGALSLCEMLIPFVVVAFQAAEALQAVRQSLERLDRERKAEQSALHAQAFTNIQMAKDRLRKIVDKAEELDLSEQLEAPIDDATKAVLGAETYKEMTAEKCVLRLLHACRDVMTRAHALLCRRRLCVRRSPCCSSDSVESSRQLVALALEAKSKVGQLDSLLKKLMTDLAMHDQSRLAEQVAAAMSDVARLRAKLSSMARIDTEDGACLHSLCVGC
jgi:hypothetical protein